MTTDNSNGTAIAVADDGTVHVAWTMGGAVYHASTKLGGTSTVDKVFDLGTTVNQAGPMGRPGIALDADGAPWIAFTAEGSKGQVVHVAHLAGDTWDDQVVTTIAGLQRLPVAAAHRDRDRRRRADRRLRRRCDQLGRVGARSAARPGPPRRSRAGRAAPASRCSHPATSPTRRTTRATGEVDVATWKDGAWSTAKVADATDPDPSAAGNLAPSTSVTVDASDTVYVAWEDSGVKLSSGTDTFAPVDIGNAVSTGSDPSLAASDNGVALSWYETTQQNQMIGFLGDLSDVLVAQPSPSLTVSQGPAGGATCGKDGKVAARSGCAGPRVRYRTAWSPPREPRSRSHFDNKDTIPHNVAIYTDSAATDALFTGDPDAGGTTNYDVKPLDAGTYFFRCDFHPTTMTGTFVVVKAAK